MCQTLFCIPHEDPWLHIPIFGFGWLLLLWSLGSVTILVVAAQQATTQRAMAEWGPFVLIVALVIWFVLPAVELPAAEAARGGPRGGLAIRGYGVMLGIAIISALGLAMSRAQKQDFATDLVMSMGTWLVIAGIAGGRLFYLMEYWEEYRGDSLLATLGSALNFSQGGLVVYGAFIGGFIAFCYFVWRRQLPFLKLADMVVPSLMLGLAIGRLGCFCNGCCYGGPTHHWWGVRFPVASVPYAEHRSSGRLHGFQIAESADGQVVVTDVIESGPAAAVGLPVGARIRKIDGIRVSERGVMRPESDSRTKPPRPFQVARSLLAAADPEIRVTTDRGDFRWRVEPWPTRSEPIQPTQLYSAVTAALICGFLLAVEPFLSWPGSLFGICLTVYPPARFLLETIRVDEAPFVGSGLSIAQNISVVMTVVAIGFWFYLWYQRDNVSGMATSRPV